MSNDHLVAVPILHIGRPFSSGLWVDSEVTFETALRKLPFRKREVKNRALASVKVTVTMTFIST